MAKYEHVMSSVYFEHLCKILNWIAAIALILHHSFMNDLIKDANMVQQDALATERKVLCIVLIIICGQIRLFVQVCTLALIHV